MQELVDRGMRAGAWGMSTGLHLHPRRVLPKTDELAAIAEVVGRHDGIYASHIRDEGDTLLESIERSDRDRPPREHCRSTSRTSRPASKPNWGKVNAAAAMIEEARDDGHRVTADQYPYDASSTSIMAMLLPDEEREGGESASWPSSTTPHRTRLANRGRRHRRPRAAS